MSKMIKILSLFFILLFLFTPICFATDNGIVATSDDMIERIHAIPNNTDTQISSSLMNTDLFIAQDNSVVENVVNGNAFVSGQTATIKGQILGDLFVIANEVIIEETADISGNIFVFASSVNFKGKASDIYAFSQYFTSDSKSSIERDLKLFASQATLKGTIQKDAYIAADKISLKDNNSQGTIYGDLHYTSETETAIPDNAVMGEVKYTKLQQKEESMAQIILNYITKFINVIVYAAFVILLVTFFAPKFADKVSYCMTKRPLPVAGIGVLAFVLVPVLCIFALITGFLAYASIAIFTLYCLMLSITISILGMAIGNYFVGKMGNKTKGKFILLSLACTAVIWLLQVIPFIGGWISIFTLVFGFGLLLCALFTKKEIDTTNSEESTK